MKKTIQNGVQSGTWVYYDAAEQFGYDKDSPPPLWQIDDAAILYDAVTYEPSSVFDASTISTKSELNVDNLEVKGILDSDGITAADLEAARQKLKASRF